MECPDSQKKALSIDNTTENVEIKKATKTSKIKRVICTVLLVLGIAFSSTASTISAKYTYTTKFDAPFLTTWFSTIFNFLIPPIYILFHYIFKLKPTDLQELFNHCMEVYRGKTRSETIKKYLLFTFFFSFLFVASIWTYVKSLSYLESFDVATLFSAHNVIIFVLSIFILRESFYVTKLLAVFISIVGVYLFYHSEKMKLDKVTGIIVTMATCFISALYKVLFKKYIKTGSVAQVCFVLTNMGIFVVFIFWIFIPIFHYTGFEILPKKAEDYSWVSMVARGCFSLIMNFCIYFGIAYSNAIIVGLGGLLALPLNALYEVITKQITFVPLKLVGSLLIIISFIAVIMPDNILDKIEIWKSKKNETNSSNITLKTIN